MAPTTERASATPVVLIAIVVATGLIAMIGRIGTEMVESARVDVYADSTALAAAGGGEAAARAVAEGNGSELRMLYTRDDGVVRVDVVRNGHGSVAAARLGNGR